VGEQAGKHVPARELCGKEQEKGGKKRGRRKEECCLWGVLFLEIGHNSFLSPLSHLIAFSDREETAALPVPLASCREPTLLESSEFPKNQEHQKRKKAGTSMKAPSARTARWPCSPTMAPAAFLALIAAARPSADCS